MWLTANRQIAKILIVNRSKRVFFYRQPSNKQAKVSRKMSQISLLRTTRLS